MTTETQQDFLDSDEEYESIPSPEHIEMIMNAALDTIDGSESLTSAQTYMQGVLAASGVTSMAVSGNEGFFSAIGDGLNKTWEYIKKMFKSIWDFFFKSGKKKGEEEVKAAIKVTEENIAAVEHPKLTPEKAEKVVDKLKAKVDAAPYNADLKNLKDKLDNLKKNMGPPEEGVKKEPVSPKAVEDLLPEVFEWQLLDNAKIKSAHDRLVGAVGRLQARKEQLDKEDADGVSINGMEIQKYLNGLIGLPDATKGIKTLADAKAFLSKASRCREAMGNTLGGMLSDQARYRQRIEECEKGINAYTGDKDEGNQKLKEQIASLKLDLASISGIIDITDTVHIAMRDICSAIDKACVLVL